MSDPNLKLVDEPSVPAKTEREKLAEMANAEKQARAQRVFEQIKSICEKENCQLIAVPKLRETPQGYTLAPEPAILPL